MRALAVLFALGVVAGCNPESWASYVPDTRPRHLDCQADLALRGNVVGEFDAPVTVNLRYSGDDLGVDTQFDLDVDGRSRHFALSLNDHPIGFGHAPKAASLVQFFPEQQIATWEADEDDATWSLAMDGSSASFDIVFAGKVGPPIEVSGSLSCPIPSPS